MQPRPKSPLRGLPGSLRAFSLTELMITMAVSVIMLGLGIPALQEYSLDKRLRASMSQLQADLNFARITAVDARALTVVCPISPDQSCTDDGAWHGGWMAFVDHNGDHRHQDSESIIRLSDLVESLSIRSAATRPQVRFSPAGTAPASNLSIVFCDERGPGKGMKLLVSHSGRIRQAATTFADSALCGERDS
ncbi:MAG: prepilin-type N-terminal cleavage/methylation domain-containing protein [Xanthomonadales bacterium]|nr:GspH/FimT family pseudopilin [Gammaproteobacteria bacterium]NNE04555.1 prepilin-type N-terminal cleavage/methylation domain-containing protein [Xanthomonadales bacterium]NNL95984.1 prepilin-type N-terminal cleavage/methylation domain-containing protein [Xanthomonadales bacterium]